MPSLPSLVFAASAFVTPSAAYSPPEVASVPPVELACPTWDRSSCDADRRPRLQTTATNAKPEASDSATARAAGDDVRVDIKEWRTPTAGAHPHDPLATRDGAIWYTGQMANLLGRLDPKTGQFREYRLKTPELGAAWAGR